MMPMSIKSVLKLSKFQIRVIDNLSVPLLRALSLKSGVGNHCKHEQRANEFSSAGNRRNKILLCVLGISGGLGLLHYVNKYSNISIVPSVEAAKVIDGGEGNFRSKFNFIADVVEDVASSVVLIEIKDAHRRDYFTGAPATLSNGSGFIVQEDGLILTNAHVVMNRPNTPVIVKMHDGSCVTGIVELVDVRSDLATIRINASKKLPVMKLGTSSNLRPGEFVVAIGSPLNLSNTITTGVISTVNRSGDELGLKNKNMDYIQTDAAITFGNSGGPLVNLDGEAIGINAMKVTAGISFAIPIDYAKEFLARAAERKKDVKTDSVPPRRYMGITMITLTPSILHELKDRKHSIPNDIEFGILVWKVIIGSPAHRSGLRPGDIVTHINGQPVQNANSVYEFSESSPTLKMTIVRDHRRYEVVITPEVYPG